MMYICLLFPALLSTGLVTKEKDSNFKKAVAFCEYCLLINFLVFVVYIFIGMSDKLLDGTHTIGFYALYTLVSLIFAVVLPKIITYCKNNFKFKINRKVK